MDLCKVKALDYLTHELFLKLIDGIELKTRELDKKRLLKSQNAGAKFADLVAEVQEDAAKQEEAGEKSK